MNEDSLFWKLVKVGNSVVDLVITCYIAWGVLFGFPPPIWGL
jgi:hypothetical protein